MERENELRRRVRDCAMLVETLYMKPTQRGGYSPRLSSRKPPSGEWACTGDLRRIRHSGLRAQWHILFGIMSGQWLGLWLGRLPGWPSPPPSLASGYQAGTGFVARDEGPIAGSMKLPRGEKWENHECR